MWDDRSDSHVMVRRAKNCMPNGGALRIAPAPEGLDNTGSPTESPVKAHPAAAMLRQGSPGIQASETSARTQPGQSHLLLNGRPSVASTHENSLRPQEQQLLPSHAATDIQAISSSSSGATGAEAHILAELDRLLGELHAAMPVNTLLLVHTVQV